MTLQFEKLSCDKICITGQYQFLGWLASEVDQHIGASDSQATWAYKLMMTYQLSFTKS